MPRARVPRDSAVHHCLEYLGSEHPGFQLEGSARFVVQFEGELSKPVLHVLRLRQLTSMYRLALWSAFPPRYTNTFVWLYTWTVASTLNVVVDSSILFGRKHMISVLAPETVRPNAVHTTTVAPIIFLSCSGDCETTPPASSA